MKKLIAAGVLQGKNPRLEVDEVELAKVKALDFALREITKVREVPTRMYRGKSDLSEQTVH